MRRRDYYWSLFHTTEKNQVDNLRTDQVEAVFAAIPKSMRKEWWIWRDGFEAWKPFDDFPQLLVSLRKADDRIIEVPPPPPAKSETAPGVKSGVKFSVKSENTKTGITKSGMTKSGLTQTKSKTEFTSVKTTVKPAKSQGAGAGSGAGKKKTPADDKSFGTQFEADDEDSASFDLTLMRTGLGEDRNNFRFQKNFEVRIVAGDKVYTNQTIDVSLKGMHFKSPLPKGLPRYFNVEIRQKDKVIPVVCSEVKTSDGSASSRVRIEVNDYAPGLLAMLLAG